MIEQLNLLVVEDSSDQYETYVDSAEESSTDEMKIVLTRRPSADGALEILMSKEFDAAIVDLNLDSTNPSEASGNTVLKTIMNEHRFPIFVVSGNLDNLEPDFRNQKSEFLHFITRDTPNAEIFSKIVNIYNTGITQILGGRGTLEEKLGNVFWNHLANDLSAWATADASQQKMAFLRYTINHLSEYLDMPDSSENKYHHEAEFYIKPPIRACIATGDIVESNECRYIVLSPACDVAVRNTNSGSPKINAARITIAKLVKMDREQFLDNSIIKEEDSAKDINSMLVKLLKGQSEKFVFLPEYQNLYAAAVDLQNLHTIEFSEFVTSYERIATVSNPFLKEIQSRFSSYYGRQGQPDLNKDKLVKKHKPGLKRPE